MKNNEIMVSVYCLAYNHEKYIRDALKGFVSQKTDFRFEVFVHDDASTDKTQSIIREYQEKYPDIIKPIYQLENQHSKGVKIVGTILMPLFNGKYVAVCEGDDYWIDEHKLQKQFDYMESHPRCTFCFTNATIINQDNNSTRIFIPYSRDDQKAFSENKIDYYLQDFYLLSFIPTASFFFKKNDFNLLLKSNISYCPVGDLRLRLFLTSLGYAHFINENTCVYRQNVPHSAMTSWKNSTFLETAERSSKNLKMLLDLDEYTKNSYFDALLPFIVSQSTLALSTMPFYSLFSDSRHMRILKAYPLFKRIKIIVSSLIPNRIIEILFKFKRKIFKKK